MAFRSDSFGAYQPSSGMTHCYVYILLEYPEHLSWYYIRIHACPYHDARFRLERNDSVFDNLYNGRRSTCGGRFRPFR